MKLTRWDKQETIFELECSSIKELLQGAISAKVSLYRANLRNADLRNANLRNANLSDADLRNADLWNADLRNADLWNANLRNADLWNADLSDANLWNANLRNADLSDADLRNANLRNADLSDANLWNANLWNANLRNANGNLKELKIIKIETYSITYTDKVLQIGCKRFTIEEWKNFDDKTINNMDGGALEFWKKWKDFIFTAIDLSYGGES